MSKGFARPGRPRGGEAYGGTAGFNVTANVLPHNKGAWLEITAATAKDAAGLWMFINDNIGSSTVDTSTLVDVGIGAAASETVVVANIPIGGLGRGLGVFLPLYIPAGTRIAARCQSAVISKIAALAFILEPGSRPGMWAGFTIAETIGVDTATSGPTTGDLTDNAWDEAVASTANPYRAVTLHMCQPPGNAAITGGTQTVVDVGMGAAGSEVVIGSGRASLATNEILERHQTPSFIGADIPAGARLAIRKNGTSDLSAALIGWR